MEQTGEGQVPVEFGIEEIRKTLEISKTEVSNQDIFKLAKRILLFCALTFMLVATLRAILDDSKGITDVWEFSKIVLNSITSLVLGLYFGKKDK